MIANPSPDFQRGWLSPGGEFVPCDYYEHASAIYRHASLTESAAEHAGWWRLTGIKSPMWYGVQPATPSQRRFLLKWHEDHGLEKPHWMFFQPNGDGGQPLGCAPAGPGGGISKA